MFNLALLISISLLVVIMLLNIVVTLATSRGGYAVYAPAAMIFVAGIVMIVISIFGKVEMLGLGFGGWGGASLFAAAIGFIVTSLVETYRQHS
ncbi:hypothetical protein SAMN04488072_11622 [Lentibacillus halodurans]|uniref:YesK-like protein n=1 Tax=Lentibacillus halodurans TaxID=237679 RepID=A0A1I1A7V2_9BACI|nr:hypothetical protein [Lentibacillus halodurans]SFB32648.1 hypothetical protein SAMN04488072_11622 [Lentibacillus halodurans]